MLQHSNHKMENWLSLIGPNLNKVKIGSTWITHNFDQETLV